MTAATADREAEFDPNELRSYPIAAATQIFLGTLVCINAAGNAVPAADTDGLIFVGVSSEGQDNSSGAAGDLRIKVRRTGQHRMIAAGLALADSGEKVYASDDQTVALTSTNFILVGRLVQFDTATSAMVAIQGASGGHSVREIESADASDLATAITLVNEIKTTLNL